MVVKIDTPTPAIIRHYTRAFANDHRYAPADRAILHLYECFPDNRRIEDVLLKVTVLNDLYGTNVYATFAMAHHILKSKFDARLRRAVPDIVEEIADLVAGGKRRRFYSFATSHRRARGRTTR